MIKSVEDAGLEKVEFDSGVEAAFDKAMSDDFNTALALSDLYGFFKTAKAYLAQKDGRAATVIEDIKRTYALLGLFKKDAKTYLDNYGKEDIPEEISALANKLAEARAVKDYATSDALRAEIIAKGYNVMISKEGITVKKA